MPDPALYEVVAERLRTGFQTFQSLANTNEADIRHFVISPVLSAIGYSKFYRRPEQGVGRNRPDDLCFTAPGLDSTGPAALIVEAKAYKADFDKAPGAESPDGQIKRYLRQHGASGPSTIGILTDGIRWRVYQRTGPNHLDISLHSEYDLFKPPRLQEFVDFLCRECVAASGAPRRARGPLTKERSEQLFALFQQDHDNPPSPGAALERLLGKTPDAIESDLLNHLELEGVPREHNHYEWVEYGFAKGARMDARTEKTQSNPEGSPLIAAAVRFSGTGAKLTMPHVALCARTFARASDSGASVVFAYRAAGADAAEGQRFTARLAVCAGGSVTMTAPFDPELPAPSARTGAERILALLTESAPLSPERLRAPLEVAPLRQQFYRDVSEWTKRRAKGKSRTTREAVLRHLIRTMFAWILKEDGVIPTELFEQAFAESALGKDNRYHREMLRFLFHQRLNVPEEQRDPHSIPYINEAMDEAPFLNGSLFQEQEGDLDLDIPDAEYWRAGDERPGLFTIFSRYHWTTDEHRPGESEQTLDPELLSNLFERLILPIETPEFLDKQPGGAYYTPADVTSEMVKDALAAAVRNAAPASLRDDALLTLFGDRSAPLPQMSAAEKHRLAARIHELRIFDPAVGRAPSSTDAFSPSRPLSKSWSRTAPTPPNASCASSCTGRTFTRWRRR